MVRTAAIEGVPVALDHWIGAERVGSATLFVSVPEGSEILKKEVFGPVPTVQSFRDEDEAVTMANDTECGLAATLYTADRARAERAADRLVAGTVWVNCSFVRDLGAPFGGARSSGIGREGGNWSFDFLCHVKKRVTSPHHWSPS